MHDLDNEDGSVDPLVSKLIIRLPYPGRTLQGHKSHGDTWGTPLGMSYKFNYPKVGDTRGRETTMSQLGHGCKYNGDQFMILEAYFGSMVFQNYKE